MEDNNNNSPVRSRSSLPEAGINARLHIKVGERSTVAIVHFTFDRQDDWRVIRLKIETAVANLSQETRDKFSVNWDAQEFKMKQTCNTTFVNCKTVQPELWKEMVARSWEGKHKNASHHAERDIIVLNAVVEKPLEEIRSGIQRGTVGRINQHISTYREHRVVNNLPPAGELQEEFVAQSNAVLRDQQQHSYDDPVGNRSFQQCVRLDNRRRELDAARDDEYVEIRIKIPKSEVRKLFGMPYDIIRYAGVSEDRPDAHLQNLPRPQNSGTRDRDHEEAKEHN
jgi:hypothetical protein